MALSLNQIVDRLRTLSLSHKQINNFYFGDPHEFTFNGDVDYPGCFIELLPGSDSRATKLKTFNLRAYFLDRVHVSEDTEGNETEVLSDMSSVADDFLAMLRYSVYEDDWEINDTSTFTPHTEFLEDMVAGISIEVGISVEFLSDRCQVPATDVTFESDFDMARTKIIPYTGTSSETSTITVTGLSGKIVLGVYRAGDYKRIITTVPTDSDKVKVTGTDLGSYKGILSSDGTIVLQVGDALVSGEVLDVLVWSN
jgi:hypothetical protein